MSYQTLNACRYLPVKSIFVFKSFAYLLPPISLVYTMLKRVEVWPLFFPSVQSRMSIRSPLTIDGGQALGMPILLLGCVKLLKAIAIYSKSLKKLGQSALHFPDLDLQNLCNYYEEFPRKVLSPGTCISSAVFSSIVRPKVISIPPFSRPVFIYVCIMTL